MGMISGMERIQAIKDFAAKYMKVTLIRKPSIRTRESSGCDPLYLIIE